MTSVITSIITYFVAIWADGTKNSGCNQESGFGPENQRPAYCKCVLHSAREAADIIACVVPIEVLAQERMQRYQCKKTTEKSANKVTANKRRKSIRR